MSELNGSALLGLNVSLLLGCSIATQAALCKQEQQQQHQHQRQQQQQQQRQQQQQQQQLHGSPNNNYSLVRVRVQLREIVTVALQTLEL